MVTKRVCGYLREIKSGRDKMLEKERRKKQVIKSSALIVMNWLTYWLPRKNASRFCATTVACSASPEERA